MSYKGWKDMTCSYKSNNQWELITKLGQQTKMKEQGTQSSNEFRFRADLPHWCGPTRSWATRHKGHSWIAHVVEGSCPRWRACRPSLSGASKKTMEINENHPNKNNWRLFTQSLWEQRHQFITCIWWRHSKIGREMGRICDKICEML